MPMACQDMLAPRFLQNGSKSLDALGKKRHTRQTEKSVSPCFREGQRVLETTAPSAASPQPAWWDLKRFRIILVSVSVCWGGRPCI